LPPAIAGGRRSPIRYNTFVKIVHDTTLITPSDAGVSTLPNHSLLFHAGQVAELGPAANYRREIDDGRFDEVIDGRRRITIPGLINTHHHLYQSLTRCLTVVQNRRLFDWLVGLYPYWRGLDYKAVNVAARASIAELLLHGCTTTSDHFYMKSRDAAVQMEAVLDAAETLGLRMHLCRGSMTLGESNGGLPPDDCVEKDADVLDDCRRVLELFHDPADLSMRRIDLAPCSPFNCTRELLRDTVALARAHETVLLHTHLAETLEEERFCLERYGCRPVQYLADLDFLGPDVYLAHCVYLNDDEIKQFAETGTRVSHCPTSNMRLSSGIAPIQKLLAAGVRVGLAVDGASSNDGGNLLAEARQALLAARARSAMAHAAGHDAIKPSENDRLLTAAEAFNLATTGGAKCLRRPVLGHLNPGAAADFAMFRSDDVALAGAYAQDPLASLILCDAPRADSVYVAGKEVVRKGRIAALDEYKLAEQLNKLVTERFREL